MIKRFYILIWILLGALTACNKDEVITDDRPKAPEIVLEENSYTTKVGREIVISPTYKNAKDATYAWVLEGTGETISTEPQLRYTFSDSTARTRCSSSARMTGPVILSFFVTSSYSSTGSSRSAAISLARAF